MTSLFFLSCAMCAQAETVSSQSIRITLNKNNVRLENILNDIESQTNLGTVVKRIKLYNELIDNVI